MNEQPKLSLSEVDKTNTELVKDVKTNEEEYTYIYDHPDEYEEDFGGSPHDVEPERSADAAVAAAEARDALKEFYEQHKDELHELALEEDAKK